MIRYKKANLQNIVSMQALVLDEVKSGTILFRSNDEMATNIRSYIVAVNEEENILGFGALHFHASDLGEIRSLIVSKEQRGMGIGKELVKRMIQEGAQLGVKQIFTLTYEKGFFESAGFIEIPKESLPAHKIWADCVKCKHFPICDEIALIKNI